MNREKQIAIAAKFYEARRLLRSLPIYKEHVVNYMAVIDGLRDEAGGHLSAALQLAKELEKAARIASLPWVLAAVAELIEPDAETPQFQPQQPEGCATTE